MDLARLGIRATVHAGEPGAGIPAVRARIEAGWGARAYDHAGMTEMGAYGYECAAQEGLHVNESEFIAEVIDPATGAPSSAGELVLTNLGRDGLAGAPLPDRRSGARRLFALPVRPDLSAAGGRHPRPRGRHAHRARRERLSRGAGGNRPPLPRRRRVHDRGVSPPRNGRGAAPRRGRRRRRSASLAGRVQEAVRVELGIRVEAIPVPARSLPRWELKARRLVRRVGE